MKMRTRHQVETAKQRAARFVRDVLGDEQRAEEIATETVDDYAERKQITIQNPRKEKLMATKRELELEETIEELEGELNVLRSAVSDAAALLPDDDDLDEDE
jgi:hypothetical protein